MATERPPPYSTALSDGAGENNKGDKSVLFALPNSLQSLYCRLKAIAQCQIMVGVACLALGTLYFVHHGATRVLAAGIWAGVYFLLTGYLGVCGSVSSRRGLIITHFVMCLHAAVIFCPGLIMSSTFGCIADLWGCNWSCSLSPLRCSLDCQEGDPESSNMRGRSVDISLICLAVVQMALSIGSAVLCAKATCEHWGVVDQEILMHFARKNNIPVQQQGKAEPLLRSDNAEAPEKSGEPCKDDEA